MYFLEQVQHPCDQTQHSSTTEEDFSPLITSTPIKNNAQLEQVTCDFFSYFF